MMAGASYLDVVVLFGESKETVFSILWQVVDAINSTAEVGPFFFPQSEDECPAGGRMGGADMIH
ncbi:unnamed protein product [Ectocarpus sp. CCAP 1310/34]|nr:unnamed protein product [Ectocarpus sp. CCAP 1310/34]